jgi:hypothetical protein
VKLEKVGTTSLQVVLKLFSKSKVKVGTRFRDATEKTVSSETSSIAASRGPASLAPFRN